MQVPPTADNVQLLLKPAVRVPLNSIPTIPAGPLSCCLRISRPPFLSRPLAPCLSQPNLQDMPVVASVTQSQPNHQGLDNHRVCCCCCCCCFSPVTGRWFPVAPAQLLPASSRPPGVQCEGTSTRLFCCCCCCCCFSRCRLAPPPLLLLTRERCDLL